MFKDKALWIWISKIVLIVGGINWGLIGLLNLNIVGLIFGDSLLARLIYIIVGVAGGYLAYEMFYKKNSQA
jgi:uncharacterized membrane protein YuzA (DUF378 family)